MVHVHLRTFEEQFQSFEGSPLCGKVESGRALVRLLINPDVGVVQEQGQDVRVTVVRSPVQSCAAIVCGALDGDSTEFMDGVLTNDQKLNFDKVTG